MGSARLAREVAAGGPPDRETAWRSGATPAEPFRIFIPNGCRGVALSCPASAAVWLREPYRAGWSAPRLNLSPPLCV